MPYYKLRSEGEPVQIGDKVSLISTKAGANHHLRTSNMRFSSDNRQEINVSASPTKWRISRFLRHDENSVDLIKSGSVLRL